MLKTQKQIVFSGGFESRLLTQKIADQIRGLKVQQIFFAADTPQAVKPLRKSLEMLSIPRNKVRCYVLLKHNPNETISGATERMVNVWQAGAIPFAQLYQPPDHRIEYSQEWRKFARIFQRPAATKAFLKEVSGHDPSD